MSDPPTIGQALARAEVQAAQIAAQRTEAERVAQQVKDLRVRAAQATAARRRARAFQRECAEALGAARRTTVELERTIDTMQRDADAALGDWRAALDARITTHHTIAPTRAERRTT